MSTALICNVVCKIECFQNGIELISCMSEQEALLQTMSKPVCTLAIGLERVKMSVQLQGVLIKRLRKSPFSFYIRIILYILDLNYKIKVNHLCTISSDHWPIPFQHIRCYIVHSLSFALLTYQRNACSK